MTRTRPHRQYVALSEIMTILARDSADALEHLVMERVAVDGWPSSNRPDGMPHGSSSDTRVERQLLALADIDAQIAQVRDDMTAIASLANSALVVCRKAMSYRVARMTEQEQRDFPVETVSICADHQEGRAGHKTWGDGSCPMPSVKAGLCQAHYFAWYRHRKAENVDTSGDFERAV